MNTPRVKLTGRSSSHYTRLVRIFCHELNEPINFVPILDIFDLNRQSYGGNPALKLPTAQVGEDQYFGSINICRAVFRLNENRRDIRWPGESFNPQIANLDEMIHQLMAIQVTVALAVAGGVSEESRFLAKARSTLKGTLDWLNDAELTSLESDSSLLVINRWALFCVLDHLDFRHTAELKSWPNLQLFRDQLAQRDAAQSTAYRFDF